MKNILFIDDDPVVRSLASGILRKNNYNVFVAKNGQEGLELAKKHKPDLVVTDYQMPGISGMEVLAGLKQINERVPVIMLTAHGDASLTIKSMQKGAFDFIEKPINPKELLSAIKNGLQASESARDEYEHEDKGGKKKDGNIMVGKSAAMLSIFKNIGRISQNYVNVLISGDPGTGKERLARLIHQSGPNAGNPLVIINCNALDLHELRAAFKEGVQNGSLVLEELGTLSLDMQQGLLDLMEVHAKKHGYDANNRYRIISIARVDIGDLVEQGLFMKELFYKLKVFLFEIPPLSERKEDIPYLVNHLLQELNTELNKNVDKIDDGVIPYLQAYDWPGNVRELRNVLMQAMVLSHGDLLQKKNIRLTGHPEPDAFGFDGEVYELRPLAEVEKEHIARILKLVRWNKQEASSVLGITRPTLNAKIEKYGLTRD